jgi:hypothetical protein
MSVCLRLPSGPLGSWNRTAKPLGLELSSLSGILGIPVEFEKRTRIGVDAALRCGAVERDLAVSDGVKLPERRTPLAWA